MLIIVAQFGILFFNAIQLTEDMTLDRKVWRIKVVGKPIVVVLLCGRGRGLVSSSLYLVVIFSNCIVSYSSILVNTCCYVCFVSLVIFLSLFSFQFCFDYISSEPRVYQKQLLYLTKVEVR